MVETKLAFNFFECFPSGCLCVLIEGEMKVKCEENAGIYEYIIRIVPLQVDTSFQNLIRC